MIHKTNLALAALVAFAGALWYVLSPYIETSSPLLPPNSIVTATSTSGSFAPEAITASSSPPKKPAQLITQRKGTYLEVIESCDASFAGACVTLRTGPGTEFGKAGQVRTGVVLETDATVKNETGTWYRIKRDAWLRYPERASGDWYVNGSFVRIFEEHAGEALVASAALPTTNKSILVDRSDQMLYAYDGDELFMKSHVSTGIKSTPTPRGQFKVYKMTPSRYMQGPLPGISEKYYDLPGVPWNLYFTAEGAVIHGAFWHNSFGKPYSNGCVNLPLHEAQKLYEWATVGTTVTVRD